MRSSKFARNLRSRVEIPRRDYSKGVRAPIVGFGTWRLPPDFATTKIGEAIDAGYRHFDCGHFFGNQRDVGKAFQDKIAAGVVKREELFITGKLWNTRHHPCCVRAACQEALNELNLEYFDNYMIHWPTAFAFSKDIYPMDSTGKTIYSDVDYVDTWRAMEELVLTGLCRSIGLSNFNEAQIQRVIDNSYIKPSNLQIECHPYLNQARIRRFCAENLMVVVAYSALGSTHSRNPVPGPYKLLEHPTIISIAEKCKRTPAQILLRYQIELNNVVITMTTKPDNMASNLMVTNFALNYEHMNEINRLNINTRFHDMKDASGHPNHPFESQPTTSTDISL